MKKMVESMDQLVVIKEFETLKPLVTNCQLKTSVRLLLVFGYNGSAIIFATNDDNVYGFGHNLSGRLGVGRDDQHMDQPVLNKTLTGKCITEVYFGYAFCVALTADGHCYSWGDNKFGQLGIGSRVNQNTPQLVAVMADERVVGVSCGSDHMLLLTSEGRVYAMGRNTTGQLGNRSYAPSAKPMALPLSQVMSISCGKCHSLALTKTGRVFVWGSNEFGQLGRHPSSDVRGSHNTSFSNNPVALTTGLEGALIAKALCGPNNTLLLSTDGRLFSFGENIYGQIGNGTRNPQYTPLNICADKQFKDIVAHYEYRMALAVSVDNRYYVWGHPIDRGFITTPTPVPESMASHSVCDIYAKYSKLFITIKSIAFHREDNGMNANNNHIKAEKSGKNEKMVSFKDIKNKAKDNCHTSLHLSANECKYNESNQLVSNSLNTTMSSMNSINDEDINPMIIFVKHLTKAFDNQSDYDLVFKIDDKSIYCHKFILQIRNKQFWQICEQLLINNSTFDVIYIKDYTYESFYSFIKFLYAMKPEITDYISHKEVIKLATIYNEPLLMQMCANMSSDVCIDLANICQLYEKAINSNLIDLQKSCNEFAKRNYRNICKLDSFRSLPDHLSKQLMRSVFQ